MCENPETGAKETLNKAIRGPEQSAYKTGGNVFRGHIASKDVEGRCQTDDIPCHVQEPPPTGPLIAMSRYGVSYLLDGEIWDLKGVTEGVH